MLKLALTTEDRKTGSPLFQVWATNETWWMRPHPEAAQAVDAQSGESAMKDPYQDNDELSEPAVDRMKKARKEDQMSSTENTPEPPISGAGGVLDAAQSAQEPDEARTGSSEAWAGWKKGAWKESSSGWASKSWKDDKSKGYKR